LSLVLALALAASAAAQKPTRRVEVRETPQAREEARRCESLRLSEGAADACQKALSLGLAERRAGAIRQIYAQRLVTLENWDALLALFTAEVAERPTASAHRRLGSLLLHAFGRPADALPHLLEATLLDPSDALGRLDLGLCLAQVGRHGEAEATFAEAEGLDHTVFDLRPGSAATREASRGLLVWPASSSAAAPRSGRDKP
jgi:tetratricopeptide (TPR) repeat protein